MTRRAFLLAGAFAVMATAMVGALGEDTDKRGASANVVDRQRGTDRFVSSGSLTVSQPVAGDLIAAGGSIEVGPKAQIVGNLTGGGGQFHLNGSVTGYVQVAGGRVVIDGPVGDDVDATSGHLELGPNARIAGKLRYRGADNFKRDPAAQVTGGVEWLAMTGSEAARKSPERHIAHRSAGMLWTSGMMLLAAVLLAALPRFYDRVALTLRTRPGESLLSGFVVLVCTPVAALILLITIIDLPMGLLTIALYLALLPVGYVSTGIALGDWTLQRF